MKLCAITFMFSKTIHWINFIKTGNPNVKGLPQWEPYNDQTGVTMVLDNKCRAVQHLDKELLQFARPIW